MGRHVGLWTGIWLVLYLSAVWADGDPGVTKSAIAVRTKRPPKIDGKLDDICWRKAIPISGFTQRTPHYGQSASRRTMVRFLYTNEALYIGMMAYQRPDRIVRRLTRRDENSPCDWLGVGLDTNLDRRTAYGFDVNPVGVQQDHYFYNDESIDSTWDGVWQAVTAITDSGWSVEYKIPYSCLRFPERDLYTWGLYLGRSISWRKEFDVWSNWPHAQSGWVSHGRVCEKGVIHAAFWISS